METNQQLTLALPSSSTEPSRPFPHIDFPLKPLPLDAMSELQRLSARWRRGQSLRSLRLHGVR